MDPIAAVEPELRALANARKGERVDCCFSLYGVTGHTTYTIVATEDVHVGQVVENVDEIDDPEMDRLWRRAQPIPVLEFRWEDDQSVVPFSSSVDI